MTTLVHPSPDFTGTPFVALGVPDGWESPDDRRITAARRRGGGVPEASAARVSPWTPEAERTGPA